MKRSEIFIVALLSFVLLTFYLYYQHVVEKNMEMELSATPAGQILQTNEEYTDIDGNSVSLSESFGKKVVALSWASWCTECVQQLQMLNELKTEYDDIEILAFNRAESLATAEDFLEFYNIGTDIKLVFDRADNFYTSISGSTMPEIVVYNATGEIFFHHRGAVQKEELLHNINKMSDS